LLQRPRGSGCTRPAAKIENLRDTGRPVNRANDLPRGEEMKRTVEKRERGTLPATVERAPLRKLRAPLDVAR
jgi:hypothetical protein